jgi:hypothetical protein
MTPDTFIELAGREGVTISATAAGGIRLSGPESAIRRLAFDAKVLKPDLLSHLSRHVPVGRDRKTPLKTKPVPAVPPVPVKNGIGATGPAVPEEPTEPKTLTFQVNRQSGVKSAMRVYHYRLTDKPGAWLTMLAPGCDLDEARHNLVLRFGPERLIEVRERTA